MVITAKNELLKNSIIYFHANVHKIELNYILVRQSSSVELIPNFSESGISPELDPTSGILLDPRSGMLLDPRSGMLV